MKANNLTAVLNLNTSITLKEDDVIELIILLLSTMNPRTLSATMRGESAKANFDSRQQEIIRLWLADISNYPSLSLAKFLRRRLQLELSGTNEQKERTACFLFDLVGANLAYYERLYDETEEEAIRNFGPENDEEDEVALDAEERLEYAEAYFIDIGIEKELMVFLSNDVTAKEKFKVAQSKVPLSREKKGKTAIELNVKTATEYLRDKGYTVLSKNPIVNSISKKKELK